MKFIADDMLGRTFATEFNDVLTVVAWGRTMRKQYVADVRLRASDGSAMWITMSEFAKMLRKGVLECA